MKKRAKFNLFNKMLRINYIKTEVIQLVKKTILINNNVLLKIKCSNINEELINENKIYSLAKQRLFCAVTNSSKTFNKKYKLSRFVFNTFGNNGKISGIYKRGW